MEDIREKLAYNLKFYRNISGLSQEELGQMSGFERTYISELERKLRNPTLDSISKLADALSIETYKLLK